MEQVRQHLGSRTGYRPQKRSIYHNLGCVWSLQESETELRVSPRPLKYEWIIPIVVTIAVVLLMVFGLPALMRNGGRMSLSAAYALSSLPLALGIFGVWLPFVFAHRRAKSSLPILMWKKNSSVVELPSLGREIPIDAVVRIEWVSSYKPDEWAEWNPVLCIRIEPSTLEWIPLMVGSSGKLDRVLQSFADRLNLPFVITSKLVV